MFILKLPYVYTYEIYTEYEQIFTFNNLTFKKYKFCTHYYIII